MNAEISNFINKINLADLIDISKQAGQIILDVRNEGIHVDIKSDNSPVTKADILSQTYINEELKKVANIPIIGEESNIPTDNSNVSIFWLVDPLDGTLEFINGSNEFTVNIALIHNSLPVLGLLYAPALNELYLGAREVGAFKHTATKNIALPIKRHDRSTALVSKNHSSDSENDLIQRAGIKNVIKMGSALKFGRIANGDACIYPRSKPTMLWDTAAGHAIINACGGKVTVWGSTDELTYSLDRLTNPPFIASI